MLFKTVEKPEFRKLVDSMFGSAEVVGPVKIGEKAGGRPIYQFKPVASFDEMDLCYDTTEYSAKTFFLPFEEELSSFRFTDTGWDRQSEFDSTPRVLLGLHACDIAALLKLDKVFARDRFPSPYYVSRRKNTLIVGIDHEPCEGGFCQSLGTNVVSHGFDLFLTDIGGRYFVQIGSDRGYMLLSKAASAEVRPEDTKAYLDVRHRYSELYKTKVNVQNLPNRLDLEFDSEVWKKWGAKCLSCGSCAQVCPTCYCYGVTERVSMDNETGSKIKRLYSCNLVDFATVAGGHNFRPEATTRLKYRYYHQHRGFVESYDEPKCVGCNRCGRVCLAGINPPDIIGELQAEVRR